MLKDKLEQYLNHEVGCKQCCIPRKDSSIRSER